MSEAKQDSALTLRYFPIHGRAGYIRAALDIGNVPFTNGFETYASFGALKAAGSLVFGSLPVAEFAGGQQAAQSNAILRYAARLGDAPHLYPVDDLKKCLMIDQVLDAVEDCAAQMGPSYSMKDEAEKKAFRENQAENVIPKFLKGLERIIEENVASLPEGEEAAGFAVGNQLTIADLRLYFWARVFPSGLLDYVPKDILAPYPRVTALVALLDGIDELQQSMKKLDDEAAAFKAAQQ